MKTILMSATTAALLSFGFAAAQTLSGAVTVDWLELIPGGAPESFELADDGGVPRVSGALTITTGLNFPGLPAARDLGAPFWESGADIGAIDSLTGDRDVAGFGFRVVPSGGTADYRLDLDLPADQPLLVAVGGLFADASGATDAALLSLVSDTGPTIPTLIRIVPWSDGAVNFSEPLDWDPSGGALSTRGDADGESRIAFFEIPALSGPNPSMSLAVPDGFSGGVGDELFVAVAAVPEPGVPTLTALAVFFLLAPRRRPSKTVSGPRPAV